MGRLLVMLIMLVGAGCRLGFDEIAGDADMLGDADTLGDAGDQEGVVFAAETHAHATNATGATLATSAMGNSRFMLVALQIGNNCVATSIPTVSSVTYGGMPLTQAASIVGSPCSAFSARSELWQLIAPPIGSADVVVTLSASVLTLHTAVLQFSDAIRPRESAERS